MTAHLQAHHLHHPLRLHLLRVLPRRQARHRLHLRAVRQTHRLLRQVLRARLLQAQARHLTIPNGSDRSKVRH